MKILGMFNNEKSEKSSSEQASKKTEGYNYEISSDIASPANLDQSKQNTLKTKYELNEDMIFPS
ncbi:hypothetical protein [Sporomusa sp.]|uniref:hypothetical protein n=1 Tax=Sporomusa sp. TaxID=2078658 RepID=UPI002C9B62AA|nr:hypothetical protein [Sporomusa sp.]HWR45601.1 hypothetical protein [Sporomusa sp.]